MWYPTLVFERSVFYVKFIHIRVTVEEHLSESPVLPVIYNLAHCLSSSLAPVQSFPVSPGLGTEPGTVVE